MYSKSIVYFKYCIYVVGEPKNLYKELYISYLLLCLFYDIKIKVKKTLNTPSPAGDLKIFQVVDTRYK